MLEERTVTHQLSLSTDEILKDYRLAYRSRQASIIGRREVFSGRAKFGIFGDGKELANLAIARVFRKGDWRSGSPMAGIIHLVRGVHVLVPRDMTRAAGFYNTLLKSEEPAIIVETLNRYRAKERLPDNIAEMTIPLGVPEVLREGSHVTLVTYGSCCRVALEAANRLANVGIEVEVMDVQSLLPFDIHGKIVESLKKTNRILFVDEDVPGGTTAYMMREVIEKQGGFVHLDSPPKTLSAEEHRPAYGSDGDYFSMPNVESIFDVVYEMMSEAAPAVYPKLM